MRDLLTATTQHATRLAAEKAEPSFKEGLRLLKGKVWVQFLQDAVWNSWDLCTKA